MKKHSKVGKKPGKPTYRTSSDFRSEVYDVVKKIPRGKTMSYKEVAEAIGRPKSFRAIGNVLNKNNDSSIPCHRVIRSDGKTGGYNKGANLKKKILDLEKESGD